jgi:predicted SAM-dependent methyltransferase
VKKTEITPENGIKVKIRIVLFIENRSYLLFLLKIYQAILRTFYFVASRIKWKNLNGELNIRLELGSGSKSGSNGFVTVDTARGADLYQNLRYGIPLGDNKVEYIYSSHLLEHITFNELKLFLKECHRVLQKDGVFSVCVPNARKYIDSYVKGNFFQEKNLMYQPAVFDTGSLIDQINYIAYMGGEHKYLFDGENLVSLLRTAGFRNVELRSYDAQLDLIERDHESIYAKGIK